MFPDSRESYNPCRTGLNERANDQSTLHTMSDQGSREGSYPDPSPAKPRRQVQMPARFRDSLDGGGSPAPESPRKSRGRGRPSSPSKRLPSLPPPSDSPVPIIVDDGNTPPPTLKSHAGATTQRVRKAAPGTGDSTPTYGTRPNSATGSGPLNVRRPVQNVAFGNTTKRVNQQELTDALKENLRKLKNLLKLPMARRWLYCEFFYSAIDEELLLADNEFSSMLQQAFPNLKTRRLTRTEWRAVRRLIGKPRRCSPAFLEEERKSLELRRVRIRNIYDGINLASLDASTDFCDLPAKIPRQFVLGMKVFARVRSPKDGVYAGHIDAICHNGYRIVFVKDELIQPMIVPDSELIPESKVELVPISYFVEQSKAALPSALKLGQSPFNPTKFLPERTKPSDSIGVMRLPAKKIAADADRDFGDASIVRVGYWRLRFDGRRRVRRRDEKVGNFPVRMLVILVKLAKLIEHKKMLVKNLSEMNTEAEKINMVTDSYAFSLQEKYARVVVDLEAVNKQMQTFLTGIQEYQGQLLPHLTEVPVTSRPEALRKLCFTHARQIVKHCNNGLNVGNKPALSMITNLTSLLLQVRSLGQQRCSPLDLNTLSESLSEIRNKLAPQNIAAFQDYVEVHMKQIHNMMINAVNSTRISVEMAVPQGQQDTVSMVVSFGGNEECFSPVTRIDGYPWRLQLVKKNNGKCDLYVLCEMSGECEFWETEGVFKLKDTQDYNEFIFGSTDKPSQRRLFHEYPLFADGTRLEVSLASQSPFFDTLFNGDFKEKNMAEIPIEDVGYEEFLMLLRMLYGENGASGMRMFTDENVLQLVDRFDLKAILLGIGNTLATWKSPILSIHEKLLIADQHGLPKWCKDRIVKQYNDDQLMELCDLMKGPKYSVISSETRQSVYEKICKAFKAAKRNIALLEKRLA
ncbi:lin-9 [Pristionchus pacificus]|uniref:Lin-9 n=1 Tax=Pristionchus pacificus TaxID=54126 RepID=A0A2A6BIJ3_PRIPA|nr:lin-9 [Pristionchus pacificus]|eukprot:PDM65648.1 lin-9 [Pristionchus pacificus]